MNKVADKPNDPSAEAHQQTQHGELSLKQYGLLGLLFLISYSYFFQGGGWNQNIRICQIRSIIHHKTLSIDAYKEDSANPKFEFVNSGDWAYFNGHYYPNKAPGLTFMAVPPYAVAEYFLRHIYPADIEKQVFLSTLIAHLCTVVLCAVCLSALLFYVCNHLLRFSAGACLLLTICFGFGTMIFSYSTIFYSHIPAALFAFIPFVHIMRLRCEHRERKRTMTVLSGFCASLSVLIEPSTVFILACLLLYLISFNEGRRLALFFILGCIPLFIVQCFYNALCFGSPLDSGYNYANQAIMIRVHGKIFDIPRPLNFLRILFLPNRGLIASSPLFVMVLPGIVLALLKKKWRLEAVVCTIISTVFILFTVSYQPWHHASTPGPRYLLPAFPYMFLLAAFALPRFPNLFMGIGSVSMLINLIITLVGNEIPHDIPDPLTDYILKFFLAGKVSVNPVPFSNFENYVIDELANIDRWKENFNAFNLGELLFPHSIASILPLLCFWALWGYLWHWHQKNMSRP